MKTLPNLTGAVFSRYALSAAIIVAATLLRWLLIPLLGHETPYLATYPALIAAAVICGAVPALVNSVLAFVLTEYFIVQHAAGGVDVARTVLTFVFMAGSAVFLGIVGDALRRERESARREAAAASAVGEKLRITLDSITDGLVTLDRDFRFTYVSRTGATMVGIDPQKAIGRKLADVFPGPATTLFLDSYERSLATNTPLHFEEYYPEPVDIWLECHCYPSSEGVAIYFRDISARKRQEHALRESETRAAAQAAQLEALLESLPDGVVIADGSGNVLFHNPASLALHGYASLEEAKAPLVGMVAAWRIATLEGEELPADMWPLSRAVRGERFSDYVIEVMRVDTGKRFVASYGGTPVRDENGALTLAVITIRNITDQHRAEEALRESEERFRVTLKHSPICVYENDRDLRYTWIYNPRFGLTPEQVVGHTDAELFPASGVDELVAMKRRVLETGHGERLQLDLEMQGESLSLSVAVEPLRDRNGIVVGLTAASIDVTELARAKAAAEEANRTKDEFIGVLSHELRTPLTPVLLGAQLLELEEDLPEHLRGYVRMIGENAELEAKLIEDLLDFTNIAQGTLELRAATVDLHDGILRARQMVADRAESKNVAVELDLAASRHVVTGDPARLRQVIWHLLSNAVKFTPAGGLVAVSTENIDGAIRIAVRDSGIGIDPSRLPAIFDAFEQEGDSVTRQFGGLGLGLAISKRVAELHDGRLSASSEGRNRGATFVLELAAKATAIERIGSA